MLLVCRYVENKMEDDAGIARRSNSQARYSTNRSHRAIVRNR